MNLKTFCTPAKIYFALAVLSAIMMLVNRVSMMAVLLKLIVAFIWTVILGWLCKHGFKMVSWALVALPFLLIFIGNKSGYSNMLLESFDDAPPDSSTTTISSPTTSSTSTKPKTCTC